MKPALTLILTIFLSNFLLAQCVSGDCRNGQGVYIYPSGAKYIGSFQDGEIHGVGTVYYTDGSRYQGNWEHRYPHGEGVKVFKDGTTWKGMWEQGRPVNEEGDLVSDLAEKGETGDDIQSGCIEGDCDDGTGTYAYPDGSIYEGQFLGGKPNGRGDFTYPDKERYVGNFKSGLPHGNGILHRPDGKQTVGAWREGEYIGNPRIDYGREGCISGDCKNGRGVYVYKGSTAKFTGTFKNGMPHGEGVAFYANGERYEGDWAAGSFHGTGTLSLMDGTEVTGKWDEGRFLAKDKPARPTPPNQEEVIAAAKDDPKISSKTSEAPPRVWAVVVGVASYEHMRALKYTDDDAYRMFAFLKSPEGGALPDNQVRILIDEDATEARIKQTMKDVFSQAGENDLVMMYFSGHGLKGAFLPIDYDGFNKKLEHKEINEILLQCPAKYKVVIADACHSGSLLAARSASVGSVIDTYYQSLAQAEPGTALILSSKSAETSLESSGLRQGVFSHFLIRGLKGEADDDGNEVVDIAELFDFIYDNVRSYTNLAQTPVIKGDYDDGMPVGIVETR